LKNTVMAIFSLKSSANFLELIIKRPSILNKIIPRIHLELKNKEINLRFETYQMKNS
jgi:hypothetical protein